MLPLFALLITSACATDDGSSGTAATDLSTAQTVPDETLPNRELAFAGCEHVLAESEYCLTLTDGGLGVLGLDSGDTCPAVASAAPLLDGQTASLAWHGEVAYACSSSELIRVSLRDGSWEVANVQCTAVTGVDTEVPDIDCTAITEDAGSDLLLSVAPFGPDLFRHTSYAAIRSGLPSAVYTPGFDSRITAHAGFLYSAWHSTNIIDVFDLTTKQPQASIVLQDYDGWVLGMAVTERGEIIISGDIWGDTLYVFDAATGTKLRTLHPSQPIFGLSCVTRDGSNPAAE